MQKARSRTILLLGMACLLLIACQTGGTPKQADGKPAKSLSAEGPKATRTADSPGKTASKTAGKTADKKRSVSAAKQKNLKAKPAVRPRKSPLAIFGRPITTLRAVLYATLGLILVVVLGAVAAERFGRRRKLA
jgi:hypothetical protein